MLQTSAEPDKFIQWALEGVGAVMGRSLVGEKLAFFCSNAQICCGLRHPLRPSKRINNTKGNVHADEHFTYDNCADDSSDDEEEEEEDDKFDYFATADAVATVDDSYAAQFEKLVFDITDAYAACGRRLEPACVEGIVEVIMAVNRNGGSIDFLNFDEPDKWTYIENFMFKDAFQNLYFKVSQTEEFDYKSEDQIELINELEQLEEAEQEEIEDYEIDYN